MSTKTWTIKVEQETESQPIYSSQVKEEDLQKALEITLAYLEKDQDFKIN